MGLYTAGLILGGGGGDCILCWPVVSDTLKDH